VLNRVVEALKLYERPPGMLIERKYASDIKKLLIDYWIKKQKEREAQNPNKDISNNEDKSYLISSAVSRLGSSISAILIKDSNAFHITVTDFEYNKAQVIANSVSRSYVIYDIEQQIEELRLKYGEKNSTIVQLKQYADDFKKTLHGRVIPEAEAIGLATVQILSQAQGASRSRITPKYLFIAFAFFAGLFIASIFAAVSEHFSNTLKTPKDITSNLNSEFLGSIPKRKKKDQLVMSKPDLQSKSICIRSFQRFGDNLCLVSKSHNIKSYLVTAFEDSGDSSALISNISLYLSRDVGKKVLIIDANLLRPSIDRLLNLNGRYNLNDMFEAKIPLESAVIGVNENLDVLTSKRADFRTIKLIDTPFMSGVIKQATNLYDMVFVDCGIDLRYHSDPIILSGYTDAVIMVIHESKDRVNDVQLAFNRLRETKDTLIFTILNNRDNVIPGILYKRI
jgi:capsular polysaccharide biosynthesis protein